MAYIFKESELPALIDAKGARERIFFVNKELTKIDDMLAGVMHYKKDAASPLHLHKNCEHFYFIINGQATVESDEGVRPVGPGDMIFIPAEEKHRLRAKTPLFYFEFQAPNRFKTTILEGTDDDLRWEHKDGRVWMQS
jgi:mannose-6-phosphate isomerase-like protein (cupin superfamily)